jgi:hypothetical protein
MVYIFFRLDSLHNYLEQENLEIKLDLMDKEQNYQKIISNTLLALHKFLKENDVNGWIKALTEGYSNFKNDKNGQFFTIINKYAALYYQSGGVLTEDEKAKFNKIVKSYSENYKIKLKEKPEKILVEMKSKIELAMELYKKILYMEEKFTQEYKEQNIGQIEKEQSEANSANRVIIKILLKHSLKYINEEKSMEKLNNSSEIKTQIELAIELLDNNEFDCSSINIFNINSDVVKSLKILLENLIIIKNKAILKGYLRKFMKETLGTEDLNKYRENKHSKKEMFFEERFDNLCNGKIYLI